MDKELEQVFLQVGYTNGQQVHEKWLNIIKYQKNANPNYSKISCNLASMRMAIFKMCW